MSRESIHKGKGGITGYDVSRWVSERLSQCASIQVDAHKLNGDRLAVNRDVPHIFLFFFVTVEYYILTYLHALPLSPPLLVPVFVGSYEYIPGIFMLVFPVLPSKKGRTKENKEIERKEKKKCTQGKTLQGRGSTRNNAEHAMIKAWSFLKFVVMSYQRFTGSEAVGTNTLRIRLSLSTFSAEPAYTIKHER